MFDETALNAASAAVFCNKTASWVKPEGVSTILVAFNIEPLYEAEGMTQVAGELITAECQLATVDGINRSHKLVIDSITYAVMSVQHDGNGWATITLEKA